MLAPKPVLTNLIIDSSFGKEVLHCAPALKNGDMNETKGRNEPLVSMRASRDAIELHPSRSQYRLDLLGANFTVGHQFSGKLH